METPFYFAFYPILL